MCIKITYFQVGDKIASRPAISTFSREKRDGYSAGLNKRTGKSGFFPLNGTKYIIDEIELPSYQEAAVRTRKENFWFED